jgi:integrase
VNLSDAIQLYLTDRQARGIKPRTNNNDRVTLNYLLSAVGNIKTQSLCTQHIDRFWMRVSHLGPASKNRAKAQLSSFFKWLQARGHLSRNVDLLEGYRKLRVPPTSRIIIPQSEFQTFLDGITDPRRRIIAAISLYLFTRISETCALRWQDFDLDAVDPITGKPKPTVDVYRSKTEQLDTLPVCRELLEELRRWKRAYAVIMGEQVQPGWLVIPGREAPKMSGVKGTKGKLELVEQGKYLPHKQAFLHFTVREMLKEAGYYQPKEGGHTFRRSGAVALYNQLAEHGHDRAMRICQAMLGHSSIQTTEIYLRLNVESKLRNDLLAGKPMFPEQSEASVVPLHRDASR